MATIAFIQQYRSLVIALFFAMIFVWEHMLPQRTFTGLVGHDIKNLGYGVLNLLVTFFGGYYLSTYLNWIELKHFGFLNLLGGSIATLAGFTIADILMYWWHRWNHENAFLWKFHSLHHGDEQMNSTTAVRFHVGELLLSFLFRIVLYGIFGLSAKVLLIYSSIQFIMIIFHHSNIYINQKIDHLIRLVITSPGMHRIHHSNKWNETNSNYTSILSCWDWVFGSYVREPKGDIKFGIPAKENEFKSLV